MSPNSGRQLVSDEDRKNGHEGEDGIDQVSSEVMVLLVN